MSIFFKKNNIENFYTLFYPYYDPKLKLKYNNLLSNSHNSQHLNIYMTKKIFQSNNIKLFFKSLIAYTKNISHVNLLEEDNDKNILEKINNNFGNVDGYFSNCGIVGEPSLIDFYYKNGNFKNIEYITSLSEQYIFFIVLNNSNIQNINDLKGKNISVGLNNSLWNIIADDFIGNNNYNALYLNIDESIKNIKSKKIDGMIISDNYPSKLLEYIFYENDSFLILPINNIKNVDFYYYKTKIDLSYLPANYIPKVIDNVKYLYYNSYMNTFKFNNLLICNKNICEKISYPLLKLIFEYKNLLKKSKMNFSLSPIKIEKGSTKYYIENGYISTSSDFANNMYLYSKQKMDNNNLVKNKINNDVYYNI